MSRLDIRDAFRRALDGFGQRVHLVRPGQWRLPTPCSGWDVRALINHLVSECLWAPELLSGRTVADVGDVFDGDVLGDDPVKAYDTAAQGAAQAAYVDGALTAVTHLSFGDVPGEEYLSELFADALIHTWDLSHAIGVTDRLDPELVARCVDWFSGVEESYREAGAIGDHIDVPEDADAQTRLLAAWGRSS